MKPTTTSFRGHPWSVTDIACAIVESVERGAIVHLDWTQECEDALRRHVDFVGAACRGPVFAAWGATDGSFWRIHLHGRGGTMDAPGATCVQCGEDRPVCCDAGYRLVAGKKVHDDPRCRQCCGPHPAR